VHCHRRFAPAGGAGRASQGEGPEGRKRFRRESGKALSGGVIRLLLIGKGLQKTVKERLKLALLTGPSKLQGLLQIILTFG